MSESEDEEERGSWRGRRKVRSQHLDSIVVVEDANKASESSATTIERQEMETPNRTQEIVEIVSLTPFGLTLLKPMYGATMHLVATQNSIVANPTKT